jgi:hypothetical protein
MRNMFAAQLNQFERCRQANATDLLAGGIYDMKDMILALLGQSRAAQPRATIIPDLKAREPLSTMASRC